MVSCFKNGLISLAFAKNCMVKEIGKRCFGFSTICSNENKLNKVSLSRTRNIGIIAHIDAGKTTVTERMLYFSGRTRRMGNVDEGDTVTDFLPAERERGITIQLAAITLPWSNSKINVIDTPGHADFAFEVTRSLRVLDGCVTILDAVAGVEAQTEKVWKKADELGISKITFINKMDREGAGFSRTVKEVIQKLRIRVVLCTLPYFEVVNANTYESVFTGVVDVLNKKILKWDLNVDLDGQDIHVIDLEENKNEFQECYAMARKSRESMVETLGILDERIVDAFLENDEDYMKIPQSALLSSIRKATLSNEVSPIFCGSAFKSIGMQPLMDAIITYLPSPLDVSIPEVSCDASHHLKTTKKSNKKSKKQTPDVSLQMDPTKGLIINNNPNLTTALIFKIMAHQTRGVLTFLRVYSGKLTTNTLSINSRTGKKIPIKKLYIVFGDELEPVAQVTAGNICVITGIEDEVITGDTIITLGPINKKLNDIESNLKMLSIEVPPPLFNACIEPLNAGEVRYMNSCIRQLVREDPSLKVSVDEELGQTILSGMGELHLDIVRERLTKGMKANVRLTDIVVAYKETLAKPISASFLLSRGDDNSVLVEVSLDSIEGLADEVDCADDDSAVLMEQENNAIIIEPSAVGDHMIEAIEQRRWKCVSSLEDLKGIVINGSMTTLQTGGPIFGLPLHSVAVRIKRFDFPVDKDGVSPSLLLEVSRQAITKAIGEIFEQDASSFSLVEPIMQVRVYINSDVLGEVIHDLTHRNGSIIAIEDDSENFDLLAWANEEAEKVYLPPDYTMTKLSAHGELVNKKVIIAEAPLHDMIGYLSRLRSMTQGKGVYNMSYVGMKKIHQSKFAEITRKFNY